MGHRRWRELSRHVERTRTLRTAKARVRTQFHAEGERSIAPGETLGLTSWALGRDQIQCLQEVIPTQGTPRQQSPTPFLFDLNAAPEGEELCPGLTLSVYNMELSDKTVTNTESGESAAQLEEPPQTSLGMRQKTILIP